MLTGKRWFTFQGKLGLYETLGFKNEKGIEQRGNISFVLKYHISISFLLSSCSTKTYSIFITEETYHNFSKALKDVSKVMVSSRLFKVANKKSSCCFGMKFIYPFIQGPKFIFTFCFCEWMGQSRTGYFNTISNT